MIIVTILKKDNIKTETKTELLVLQWKDIDFILKPLYIY